MMRKSEERCVVSLLVLFVIAILSLATSFGSIRSYVQLLSTTSSSSSGSRALLLTTTNTSSTFIQTTVSNVTLDTTTRKNASQQQPPRQPWLLPPKRIHKSKQRRPPPSRIFTCGHDQQKLFRHLFPEYAHLLNTSIKLTRQTAQLATDHDMVVVGLGGWCDGWRDRKLDAVWMSRHFKGIAIHFNGEPYAYGLYHEHLNHLLKFHPENETIIQTTIHPSPRQFQIGAEPDTYNDCHDPISVQVSFMAMFFLDFFMEQQTLRNSILVPGHRATNTGERFLLYTARRCVDAREDAFDRIASLVRTSNTTLYHGSKCFGKVVNKPNIQSFRMPSLYEDNYQAMHRYRFCLVMENTNRQGYITEKILLAFAGGCIPIYYGTTDIFNVFNPQSFIYYDIEHPEPALEQILRMEHDQDAYQQMLQEPILRHYGNHRTIQEYFSLSDTIVPHATLKQKIRDMILYHSSSTSSTNDDSGSDECPTFTMETQTQRWS